MRAREPWAIERLVVALEKKCHQNLDMFRPFRAFLWFATFALGGESHDLIIVATFLFRHYFWTLCMNVW